MFGISEIILRILNIFYFIFILLQVHSLDSHFSQLSFTELEPRGWVPEPVMAQTPPLENGITNQCYLGICLPRILTAIFPDLPKPVPPIFSESLPKYEDDLSKMSVEANIDNQAEEEHTRICLVCDRGKAIKYQENGEDEAMLNKLVDAKRRTVLYFHFSYRSASFPYKRFCICLLGKF